MTRSIDRSINQKSSNRNFRSMDRKLHGVSEEMGKKPPQKRDGPPKEIICKNSKINRNHSERWGWGPSKAKEPLLPVYTHTHTPHGAITKWTGRISEALLLYISQEKLNLGRKDLKNKQTNFLTLQTTALPESLAPSVSRRSPWEQKGRDHKSRKPPQPPSPKGIPSPLRHHREEIRWVVGNHSGAWRQHSPRPTGRTYRQNSSKIYMPQFVLGRHFMDAQPRVFFQGHKQAPRTWQSVRREAENGRRSFPRRGSSARPRPPL